VVIGVGMRGSVLELSPLGASHRALGGDPTERPSLSEVMAPHAQPREFCVPLAA
jgi:hypothetical protein